MLRWADIMRVHRVIFTSRFMTPVRTGCQRSYSLAQPHVNTSWQVDATHAMFLACYTVQVAMRCAFLLSQFSSHSVVSRPCCFIWSQWWYLVDFNCFSHGYFCRGRYVYVTRVYLRFQRLLNYKQKQIAMLTNYLLNWLGKCTFL